MHRPNPFTFLNERIFGDLQKFNEFFSHHGNSRFEDFNLTVILAAFSITK